MKLRCRLGFHHFRGWVAHTDGPCLFHEVGEVHVFRYCMRYQEGQHLFATINNGSEVENSSTSGE